MKDRTTILFFGIPVFIIGFGVGLVGMKGYQRPKIEEVACDSGFTTGRQYRARIESGQIVWKPIQQSGEYHRFIFDDEECKEIRHEYLLPINTKP